MDEKTKRLFNAVYWIEGMLIGGLILFGGIVLKTPSMSNMSIDGGLFQSAAGFIIVGFGYAWTRPANKRLQV